MIRCGIDLVKHSDFKSCLGRDSFCKRVFHPSERKYTETEKLAGIFALKEAVIKALSMQSRQWLDIEVKYEKNGRPTINLAGYLRDNVESCDCSVSHAKDYTVAVAVFNLRKYEDSSKQRL